MRINFRHRFLLLTALLGLLALLPVRAGAQVTVGTSTLSDAGATDLNSHRAAWSAVSGAGRWYVCYNDGSNWVWATSPDGTTWTGQGTIPGMTGVFANPILSDITADSTGILYFQNVASGTSGNILLSAYGAGGWMTTPDTVASGVFGDGVLNVFEGGGHKYLRSAYNNVVARATDPAAIPGAFTTDYGVSGMTAWGLETVGANVVEVGLSSGTLTYFSLPGATPPGGAQFPSASTAVSDANLSTAGLASCADKAGNLHVVYQITAGGATTAGWYETVYNGTSWTAGAQITQLAASDASPALSCENGGTLHLVYARFNASGDFGIGHLTKTGSSTAGGWAVKGDLAAHNGTNRTHVGVSRNESGAALLATWVEGAGSPYTLKAVALADATPAPSFTVSPNQATTGVSETVTATGTNTAWTSGTTFSVSGGSGASISGVSVNAGAQTATFTLAPGSATGPLTISDGTDSATATVTAVAPASLSVSALGVTPGASSLLLADTASGGQGPYTHRLYRGAAYGFAPTGSTAGSGNCVAVQTAPGLSFTDAPPVASTLYYYIDVVTDSEGTPATVSGASTPGASFSRALTLGFIGDSISVATDGSSSLAGHLSAPQWCGAVLQQQMGGMSSVTVVNQAVSGSSTGTWQPGGTNYVNALAAFVSPAQTPWVCVMLGHNETGETGPQYQTSLNTIVSDLVTRGYKVVLNDCIYTTPVGPVDDTLAAFNTAMDSLVASYASSDPGTVYRGDANGFAWFADFQAELSDGTHPTQPGYQHLGTFWANSLRKIIAPDAGAGGAGGTKRRLQ